jgi:hypothetical protein
MQELQFETEAGVKMWMINNQFNRRNLPIATRMKLAYRFKEIEAEKAKEGQLACLKQFAEEFPDMEDSETDLEMQQFAKTLPVTPLVGRREERGRGALGEIAKMAGVGHTTAEQYDTIQRKGTDEQKAQVDAGDSSIKKVYTQIQRAERLEKYPLLNQLPEVA